MKFYQKIRFPSKVDQKTDLEELDSPKMNSGVSILGELVFFPQQMLTSVQLNLLRAIQTLIAPIVTALLAVLVNRDSLVMEEFVKVLNGHNINYFNAPDMRKSYHRKQSIAIAFCLGRCR